MVFYIFSNGAVGNRQAVEGLNPGGFRHVWTLIASCTVPPTRPHLWLGCSVSLQESLEHPLSPYPGFITIFQDEKAFDYSEQQVLGGAPMHRYAHLILNLCCILPAGKIKRGSGTILHASLSSPGCLGVCRWDFSFQFFVLLCFCPGLVLKSLSLPSVYSISIFLSLAFSL